MKHLFQRWENIQDRIEKARDLILFLDYDGTLAPIAARPELALCPPETKRRLEELRDLPGVYLAVISGRSLADVREKVGVSGIVYVGNHGLEVENAAGKHKEILTPSRKKDLKRITRNLQDSLKEIPGLLFEEKGPILSVHYRNVSQQFLTRIPRIVESELRPWGDHWVLASGKMVLEIRPNINFNKGETVRKILKTFSSPESLAIYVGDDQTDEDAFRVVKKQGVSVYVGEGGVLSEADFFLYNPGEVQEFLFRCEKARRAGTNVSDQAMETGGKLS